MFSAGNAPTPKPAWCRTPGGDYDVVLVAVRRDQLASACAGLAVLAGKPAVVFFGNNPAGRLGIPADVPGDVYLGFPGAGGVMAGGIADYARIRQQPTALPAVADPRLAALEATLSGRGFAVQRVTDMDGWLAYHAAFVACVAAALYRCGTDPGPPGRGPRDAHPHVPGHHRGLRGPAG